MYKIPSRFHVAHCGLFDARHERCVLTSAEENCPRGRDRRRASCGAWQSCTSDSDSYFSQILWSKFETKIQSGILFQVLILAVYFDLYVGQNIFWKTRFFQMCQCFRFKQACQEKLEAFLRFQHWITHNMDTSHEHTTLWMNINECHCFGYAGLHKLGGDGTAIRWPTAVTWTRRWSEEDDRWLQRWTAEHVDNGYEDEMMRLADYGVKTKSRAEQETVPGVQGCKLIVKHKFATEMFWSNCDNMYDAQEHRQ